MSRRTEYFPLQGGINTADPALLLPPGELLDSRNYECALRTGYRRMLGYERFSGKQSPSTESYWILNFDAGVVTPVAGDAVTGQNSGATAIVVTHVLSTGTFAGGDAVGYLVLRSVSGTFVNDENIRKTGPTTLCVANGAAASRNAATDELDATYLQAAMEAARTAIAAVPGSGNVLGVWVYKGVTYAFRNNAGDTATDMYKSTTGGWSQVALGYSIPFNTGTAEVTVGQTVTGATSGASAVVTYVQITSGTWGEGDAAGYLHFTTYGNANTFDEATENLQVGGLTKCVSTAIASANTLTKDGVYEFINYNFYGSTATQAMYGVNGVNKGFAFDGTNFAFIHTGMTVDTPDHIYAHKRHLFFSFPGGSVQHSSIGEPLEWNAITGAAELALGDECTGIIGLPGETLGLFCRNSRFILQGSSSSDWNLVAHNLTAGSVEWTLQDLGLPVYLDDRGLNFFQQSDLFGDFVSSAFSYKFQQVLDQRKSLFVSSLKVREKSQYRLHFSDNTGLVITFDNTKLLGASVFEYDDPIYCCCSSEDSNGNEILFGGSSDGYVYQLDAGNNFDGGAIDAWIRPVFAHFKSPQNRKRFFKVVLDIDAESAIDMAFLPEFAYGDTFYPIETEGDLVTISGGGGSWDISTWETFYWDAPSISSAYGYLQGVGENISIFIRSVGTYDEPHTLQGIIFHLATHGVTR